MTFQHDNYEFWKAWLLTGQKPEISKERVPLGFFKMQNGTPVAIWECAPGEVVVLGGTARKSWRMTPDKISERLEYGGFGVAVKEDAYRHAFEKGEWPDAESAERSDNAAPQGVEGMLAEIEEIAARAAPLLKEPITEKEKADLAANLRDKLLKISKEAEETRKAEKQPHMDAAKAVDEKWTPARDRAKAGADKLRDAVGHYLREEEKKAQAEARRIAEEKAAEAAKNAPADEPAPVVTVEPVAPVRVGQTGARTGLRTVKKAEITDYAALLAHFAEHADVRAAIEKLAGAAARAGIEVPGMKIIDERIAA